jgi:hypothetical protein
MEPTSIRAGDSTTWTRDEAVYLPADGWSLAYRLIPSAGAVTEISTTGSGVTYTATLSATATAALTAGRCRLIGYASRAGEYHTVHDDPGFQVLANLRTATSADPRSANEIELAAARAAWDNGALSYTVGDRSVTHRTAADIKIRIDYLQQQVAAERAARAIASGTAASTGGRMHVKM